jgi:glycosyltransferase involved in cell wall biosynthesis
MAKDLSERLVPLRRTLALPPDASVVIPVNANGDLHRVLGVVGDIAHYSGEHSLEIVLVINNYPPDNPPEEIETYKALGLRVISIPNIRRHGEAASFTARIPGLRAAASERVLLFDSDCRIPNATALVDWYIRALQAGQSWLMPRWGIMNYLIRWPFRYAWPSIICLAGSSESCCAYPPTAAAVMRYAGRPCWISMTGTC